MKLFIYITLYLLNIALYYYILKKTVFSVSLRDGYLAGFLLIREVFLLILLGVLLFGLLPISYFNVTYVSKQNIDSTSILIFLSVSSLIFFIGFFSKTIFKKRLVIYRDKVDCVDAHNEREIRNIKGLIVTLIIISLILILINHTSGVKHAFLSAVFSNERLIDVRLFNKYEVNTIGYFSFVLRYSVYFLAIFLGSISHSKLRTPIFALGLLTVLYGSSMAGDKMPIVQSMILYFIAKSSTNNLKVLKLIIISTIATPLVFLLIFNLVKVQYPEMTIDIFVSYLIDRLGVGQIQGVYEQFGLKLRDFSYIYKEIPLSGMFVMPTNFSKDLMMSTWGYSLQDNEIGVMNSFFIGEAFAIGGYLLLFLSPIFVAFNFCAITSMCIFFISSIGKITLVKAQKIGAIFSLSVLMFTGDLNGMLLGKRWLFLLFYFVFVFSVFLLLKKFKNAVNSHF